MTRKIDKPKRGRGRPPYEPTEKQRGQVETMVAFGMPQRAIARKIGISVDTLEKHYREELDYGKAEANLKVAQTLYNLAVGTPGKPANPTLGIPAVDPVPPNVSAAIFWAKTQLGWRDVNRTEHVGGEGGPIEITPVQPTEREDFSGFSDEELEHYAALKTKARQAAATRRLGA